MGFDAGFEDIKWRHSLKKKWHRILNNRAQERQGVSAESLPCDVWHWEDGRTIEQRQQLKRLGISSDGYAGARLWRQVWQPCH